MTQNLAGFDLVAHFHRHRAGLHVRIECVTAPADIHHHVVSVGVEDIEVDSELARMRNVFGNSVQRLNHPAVRDAVDWYALAEVAFVLMLGSRPGAGESLDHLVTHPVNRVALREPGLAAQHHERPAMGRVGILKHKRNRIYITICRRSKQLRSGTNYGARELGTACTTWLHVWPKPLMARRRLWRRHRATGGRSRYRVERNSLFVHVCLKGD